MTDVERRLGDFIKGAIDDPTVPLHNPYEDIVHPDRALQNEQHGIEVLSIKGPEGNTCEEDFYVAVTWKTYIKSISDEDVQVEDSASFNGGLPVVF